MKKCSKCQAPKELSEFGKNKNNLKDGTSSYCKECMRSYTKVDFENKKEYYKKRMRLYKRQQNKWYRDLKESLSCIKCGFSHPAVIDFHHRDPKDKEFTISVEIYNGFSIERIMKEIEKCDVLCSNCHRIEHWENEEIKFQKLLEEIPREAMVAGPAHNGGIEDSIASLATN